VQTELALGKAAPRAMLIGSGEIEVAKTGNLEGGVGRFP